MKPRTILLFITFVYLAIVEARYLETTEGSKQVVVGIPRLSKRKLFDGSMSSGGTRSQGTSRDEVRAAGNSNQNFVDSLIGSGTSIRI